jgi:hypothetical protein
MAMTADELKATCCIPAALLLERDAVLDRTLEQRVHGLTLSLLAEQECNLTDALELTNNPDAELPFTGVADWREAYLELAKRHVRQINEILFELAGVYSGFTEVLAEPATDTAPQAPRLLH